ncbi:MAG: PorV/PorQ family protein [Candidatus Marinimicrobia bacterium]|uniref:PorV/PorQ family protein n=1 Tax=uncultured bacterium FPPU_33B15 TaxID=1343848 RepID=S4W9Z7_9BACT|nr:hypothetical protein [uncultured bacterium FPPU_33B15]MBT3502693.1 PorV/PorQ family protein [Candidatus Neomarinimicrobiota bacterium]MBT3839301.1 PorV/PorQ family protein [Candidatus Neomarinimicrobiota bacterium]MBT4000027.1 PorV/PorQ family protein [Candidatus Neomarinimicrobiota bacterium]MBT4579995.1 PorV/PorQ family protein [Candidatus Neomarinimicrobiota bacterium]
MRRILIVLLMPVLLFCQYRDIPDVVTKVATAAGGFLKLETSARAIGMGGAHVASARGVSGIPYNPASIAFIQKSEVYFSQVNYLAGIKHGVLTYGTRLGPSDFIGFHLFYLDSGPMDVTTEDFPDGTGEDFSVISMAARFTYARSVTDRLKLGGSLNYIRDRIADTGMQAVSYDIGSNFSTGIYGTILGMSVTNFGPEVQYKGEGLSVQVADTIDVDGSLQRITDKFPLPLMFRVGVENELIGLNSSFMKSETHRLIVSMDGIKPSDYIVYGSVGLEYSWQKLAFVRLGSHLGHDTAGFSMGAGVNIRLGKMALTVDYAFVDYDILKYTNQLAIGLEF